MCIYNIHLLYAHHLAFFLMSKEFFRAQFFLLPWLFDSHYLQRKVTPHSLLFFKFQMLIQTADFGLRCLHFY